MISLIRRTAVAVAAAGLLAGCSSSGPSVVSQSASNAQSTDASSATGSSATTSGSEPASSSATDSASAASSTSTSTESSSAAASSSSSGAKVDLKVGQCFTDDWESSACTSPHAYEISAIVQDNRFGDDITKRQQLKNFTCNEKMASYTGGPAFGSLILGEPVEAAHDPKADQQIACLVYRIRGNDSGSVDVSTSLKDFIKKNGLQGNNLCADAPDTNDIKIVACSQPHDAEATGGFIDGKFGDPYPGDQKLWPAADKKCQPITKAFLGGVMSPGLKSAQNSSGAGPWGRGTQLTACFAMTTDGKKLTDTVWHLGSKARPTE